MLDQELHDRSGNHTGKSKSHDSQPRRKSPVVRKPFDQGRNRRNVTCSQADTADDPIEEVQQRQAVEI